MAFDLTNPSRPQKPRSGGTRTRHAPPRDAVHAIRQLWDSGRGVGAHAYHLVEMDLAAVEKVDHIREAYKAAGKEAGCTVYTKLTIHADSLAIKVTTYPRRNNS